MGKVVQKKNSSPKFIVNDTHGCLAKHGATPEDMLELSGGMPVTMDFQSTCEIVSLTEDFVKVIVESDIYECERRFNFTKGVIRNIIMTVMKKGEGTGRALFVNQLLAARTFNFGVIKIQATGGDAPPEWNGHYTFGRFGFTMEAGDEAVFQVTMRNDNRYDKTLAELLSTDEGRAYWIESGSTWAGIFDTDPNSENSKLLNDYLIEKGLDPL